VTSYLQRTDTSFNGCFPRKVSLLRQLAPYQCTNYGFK